MARNVKTPSKTNPEPDQRRSYRSELRTQQAKETRRTIRDAAEKLFLANGYVATSINAIAEEAGVAPETVYATFKNKRALLKELIDVSVAGDDEPVALIDRPWFDEIRAEPDQRRALRMLDEAGLARVARAGPMEQVLAGAAASDPQLHDLHREQHEARRRDVAQFVDLVLERGDLRVDRETAIDVVWAIGGADVWRALVVESGWSVERYIQVVHDIIERFGLPDAPAK
ncbi:MAG TPA: TetR/AcrR family transcriptional regulator [Acidimicrobiia bacterium]|jgi:TetR/AcrR family transcriptional regulator of autoinduction and epiphytic fitness|nr:TetR/AcrR family transcriptional regulator [Acidimicrobiia bacterium]